MRHRTVSILIAGFTLLMLTSSSVSAQGVPYCGPGQFPRFATGFATLSTLLGPVMGAPVECEHPNDANGDTVQRTSTGLAYWRKSTNTATFTDGYRHWAITPDGLITWVGASPDPPVTASIPASTAAPPPPSPTPRTGSLQAFVEGITGQLDEFWKGMFAGIRTPYSSPRVRWVPRGVTAPRCGGDIPQGAAYCPFTRTLVLPAEFFDRIWQQDADAAVVVVVAHEWGHHVQRLLGITSGNFFTIQIELQADCLGGVFFNYANQQGWLDPGDLDEALAMSWSGGDPVLVAWFEEGAHGSPQQRVAAFRRGFQGQQSCAVYTS